MPCSSMRSALFLTEIKKSRFGTKPGVHSRQSHRLVIADERLLPPAQLPQLFPPAGGPPKLGQSDCHDLKKCGPPNLGAGTECLVRVSTGNRRQAAGAGGGRLSEHVICPRPMAVVLVAPPLAQTDPSQPPRGREFRRRAILWISNITPALSPLESPRGDPPTQR